MTWSLNELEAETRKALRGAGLPWGLAEEGGKAVRWLAAHGVDPVPALSDILERHDRGEGVTTRFAEANGRWHATAPICPITLGAALCDNADRLSAVDFVAGPIARPLLIAPFAAFAARILGRSLRLSTGDLQIAFDERGDPAGDLSAIDVSDVSDIHVRLNDVAAGAGARAASTRGIAIAEGAWARVAPYVQRTYVPASELSRRHGAGAGLLDND
ncbi:DUF3726 domain-containing protein [Pseudorhodoplanes sp.]|uniref:DUF3726 domain-containing protein n=1 Tax=Pseudorhodoplanes sp. TaxID=1934341 RepID=UPI002C1E0D4E|nr:DUF3726 domain-containing protein [Pseudorhodoplanes sp.]HWV42257.1 DUF3726 domain-containing protein [Pseudorhodoplanes sp.]